MLTISSSTQQAPCRSPRPHHLLPLTGTTQGDHRRSAHLRQVAIYRAMTPQERLRQGLRMNQTMRALLSAGFRERHPNWSEAEVRRAVADRVLHARTG
jgi:hypothetical protein